MTISRLPPVYAAASRVLPGIALPWRTSPSWHERLGKCADEIATEYDLTLSDVYAALAYYFDHREEIDQSIKESEEFAEAFRQQTFSKLVEKLQEKR